MRGKKGTWMTRYFGTMMTKADMVADTKMPTQRNTTTVSMFALPKMLRKYVKLPTTTRTRNEGMSGGGERVWVRVPDDGSE